MNRSIMSLLLAAALVLSLCGAALAANPSPAEGAEDTLEPSGVVPQSSQSQEAEPPEDHPEAQENQPESGNPESEADEAPAEIAPDPVGSVSFANLDSRLRENNFNMLALSETIASIEAIDYEKMTDDIRKQINQIAQAQWGMITMMPGGMGSFAASSMDSAYDSLRDVFDDLKDGEIQEDNAAVIRQLKNAQDQIVMAAESLYIALVDLEMNDKSLDRQLTALDRTIQELDLRYQLGQVSSLTLQQTKAGRTALVSGQQTLEMNIANYKAQLEMLIGAEQTGKIQLQTLPQVTGKQLAAMDLEEDLATAKEASYALFDAERTLNDAREDFKDAGKDYNYNEKKYQYVSAQHTWESAQYTYNATLQSFENSFRTLYNQVKDYQQVLEAAKTALACQKDTYASMQLKYEQGNLSKNKLLDAADEVTAAQEKVDSAAIDLFSAYHNYRWAVERGILN